jgi:hypothetical protein
VWWIKTNGDNIMRSANFTCGPFAEVKERIEDFGTALYFSQLYYDTIMELKTLQEKLQKAKDEDNKARTRALKEQILFIENICSIDNFDAGNYPDN